MAELWRAKVYEQGTRDYDKARTDYARVARTAGFEFPILSSTAKVGELRCLVLADRHQEALLGARRLTARNGATDPVVLANAWSVIGDCLIAAGNGPEKSNDALLAYLRVVIVYDRDPGLTARAAYKAAECFEKTEHADRAREMYRRASTLRGGGEWSRKAAERLKGADGV